MRRHLWRVLAAIVGVVLVIALALVLWIRAQLVASLPQLDGSRQITGLTGPVTVTRDGLGIPTVRGTSRLDVAMATGFLHAQDRFFQMDLARRRAAGELSALVGARAIALDREIRRHRFRAEAVRALSLMTPHDRAIVDAYTNGVNSGLSGLGASPFEYRMLRQTPQPWRPEDSLLVILSMFVTLQDTDGSYEATLATMHDILPREMFELLAPRGTEWDAPVAGATFSTPPIPPESVYNLRARRRGKPGIDLQNRRPLVRWAPSTPNPEDLRANSQRWDLGVNDEGALGSNNWAVAGRLTADGRALVANDMHLSVRVPNTWYRAALEWPDPMNPAETRHAIGVTLPGVPSIVVGSNTYVAWGFTNTYADWGDLVLLDMDPNLRRYQTPDGWKDVELYDESIQIAGQDPEPVRSTWTIWGPILGRDNAGRYMAYRWVAHSAERLAASLTPIEGARTLEEALDEANGVGAPGQNFVVADRTGRIAWSVYGAIPKRVGIDGMLPASWTDGTRGWNGWLADSEYPRIIDPPDGRIWTANARVVDGDMLAKLGDGSYEVGSRAGLIHERLMAKDRFTVRDMLDIQLDTRATFLGRWRDLILRTLSTAGTSDRIEFRRLVETTWDGHASPGSAAYRLTRLFREQVTERVMAFVLAECYEADLVFDYTTVRRREGPIWKIVSERPMHLLDSRYASWDELLVSAVDSVIEISRRDGTLSDPWSHYNVTAYRHPLSGGLPFVGRWLDMPAHDLPGDLFTPRMHWGNNAASERMVVSPGHEAEGIMHMPTGQSGNPLSPYYRNSHDAWVSGSPTPFLPGATEHTLTLVP